LFCDFDGHLAAVGLTEDVDGSLLEVGIGVEELGEEDYHVGTNLLVCGCQLVCVFNIAESRPNGVVNEEKVGILGLKTKTRRKWGSISR